MTPPPPDLNAGGISGPASFTPSPVQFSPRIISLDVLRGIALLGALFVSIWIFGGFSTNQQETLLLQSKGLGYRFFGAAELLFTGRSMSADEGFAWGFWNRLTADPLADAMAIASDLASGPTLAHTVTKHQLEAEWNVSIETALDMEAEAQARLMQTNDFKRAYQAFSAKHQPVFRGD